MAPPLFFEGFEKRLELQFSNDHDHDHDHDSLLGLRRIPFSEIEKILARVQCAVVSAVANAHYDSYVLSESSLFVSKEDLIIKTCGSTKLLYSLPPLLKTASSLGYSLNSCKYTRGAFLSPSSQPPPHSSFSEELSFLHSNLPSSLSLRLSSILPSAAAAGSSWHLFYAARGGRRRAAPARCTVEICMTGVERAAARGFYGGGEGRRMREATGVAGIISEASVVCDFAFEPCGYSMNGVEGECYCTVHVTPEEGFSYASFECVGEAREMARVVGRVARVFRPAVLTVAISGGGGGAWREIPPEMEALGMRCGGSSLQELPDGGGDVVFQMYGRDLLVE